MGDMDTTECIPIKDNEIENCHKYSTGYYQELTIDVPTCIQCQEQSFTTDGSGYFLQKYFDTSKMIERTSCKAIQMSCSETDKDNAAKCNKCKAGSLLDNQNKLCYPNSISDEYRYCLDITFGDYPQCERCQEERQEVY